jgi:hypothetical protein
MDILADPLLGSMAEEPDSGIVTSPWTASAEPA